MKSMSGYSRTHWYRSDSDRKSLLNTEVERCGLSRAGDLRDSRASELARDDSLDANYRRSGAKKSVMIIIMVSATERSPGRVAWGQRESCLPMCAAGLIWRRSSTVTGNILGRSTSNDLVVHQVSGTEHNQLSARLRGQIIIVCCLSLGRSHHLCFY